MQLLVSMRARDDAGFYSPAQSSMIIARAQPEHIGSMFISHDARAQTKSVVHGTFAWSKLLISTSSSRASIHRTDPGICLLWR